MSVHRLLDWLLIWYFHHLRRTRPFAPLLVDDYLPKLKLQPKEFFAEPRGLWSPERERFPTPKPLDWADRAVNTAHISPLIKPPADAQDAVLWVHGFLMDDAMVWHSAYEGIVRIARTVPAAHYFLRLPLHFERKQRWGRRLVGAEWTFQNAPFRLLEVIALGVNEAREFVRWWLNNRSGKVVAAGISLGGNVVGWIPVLEGDERIGAVPYVPALDLPQVFSVSPLVKPLREGFVGDVELIARYLEQWSPISHPLATPSERVRVLAGAEDGILPSPQLIGGLAAGAPCERRTIQAWEKVCVQAVHGGHGSWAVSAIGKKDAALFAEAIKALL